MRSVEPESIIQQRLLATRLDGERVADPVDVVRWFGAMQAQEYEPAQWSIGMRTDTEDPGILTDALASGRIVRLHILRPTWHFVAAQDHAWIVAATGEAVDRRNSGMYRRLELDAPTLRRTNGLIVDALRGGAHLTRKAIAEQLGRAGVEANGQRLAYIVMHAELRGLICSGVMQGKQHTYALVDERVPEGPAIDRDEALGRLALRYFESHGPALVRDLRWWAHIDAAEASIALDAAAPALASEVVGGDIWWFARELPAVREQLEPVRMLQGYDEYFSHKDKRLVDPDPNARLLPSFDMYPHAILLGGRVVGGWRQRIAPGQVFVQVAPYEVLEPTRTGSWSDVRNLVRRVAGCRRGFGRSS
jgi:hypothetical protein